MRDFEPLILFASQSRKVKRYMDKMKNTGFILFTLLLVSCVASNNETEAIDVAVKQSMTCREAAYKIYEELNETDKAELEAITTIQELRTNQSSRDRVYIVTPYYSYPGVNESCAAINGKEKVHFEILPFILTEWVWTIVRNNM
ncbi:hypothetical protein [Aliikangiella sp. IMCC44632]